MSRKKTRDSLKKYYKEHPGIQKEIQNRSEVRAKNRASNKKRYESPIERKKTSDSLKKYYNRV